MFKSILDVLHVHFSRSTTKHALKCPPEVGIESGSCQVVLSTQIPSFPSSAISSMLCHSSITCCGMSHDLIS